MSRDRHEKEHLFTGALLHDLGRMVFLFREPEAYVPLIEFDGSWPTFTWKNECSLSTTPCWARQSRTNGISPRK